MGQDPQSGSWRDRHSTRMNRFHARLAGRGTSVAAFESSPEPRTIGSFARGRQLIAGNLLFAGFLVQKPAQMIWEIEMPSVHFETALHGFQWLDDLAAVGDIRARDSAQSWTWGWIAAFGGGKGVGWSPSLTGRRLIRWINHAVFLLNGRKPAESEAYFRSLAAQCRFLARRWKAAPQGLPRFEALVGLIYAGLALKGMDKYADPATKALARECEKQINDEGGLSTRNPEELLEVFTLLTWANLALQEAGKTPPAALLRTIERIAPTLRALRHADGGLARFHGGDRGLDGRLDHALANCGVRSRVSEGPRAMGFARLSAGRTTVIQDAAAPPTGHSSTNAHASTLSFELTSGRRPLIVNCGSGTSFGDSWRRAGRATPSHSTLGITGYSSSRLEQRNAKAKEPGWERLVEVPKDVRLQRESSPDGTFLLGGHSGYVATHGLTHVRKLTMSPDGRQLSGDDTLSAFTAKDRATFDDAMTRSRMTGAEFTIRFHLHPDVDAKLDLGGTAVSLALKSMEIWILRHDGLADLTLEPSVYLESGRLKPRSSRQIVLTSKVLDYARQIRWTLAKAQDTPQGIRDLARSDDLPLD